MRRPYFFEIFTIANFVILQLVLWRITHAPLAMLLWTLLALVPIFLVQALLGIGVRLAAARSRRSSMRGGRPLAAMDVGFVSNHSLQRDIGAHLRLDQALRAAAARGCFDGELSVGIDRAIFFGHSPNISFSISSRTRCASSTGPTPGTCSSREHLHRDGVLCPAEDERLRIGFMNANTLMWIAGAWLYPADSIARSGVWFRRSGCHSRPRSKTPNICNEFS
jgi:hypothetical protein